MPPFLLTILKFLKPVAVMFLKKYLAKKTPDILRVSVNVVYKKAVKKWPDNAEKVKEVMKTAEDLLHETITSMFDDGKIDKEEGKVIAQKWDALKASLK